MTSAHPLAIAGLTEAEFSGWVVTTARLHGWVAHVTERNDPFPDLLLVHPERGEIVFAELKAGKATLTKAQAPWHDALGRAGADVVVWRPDDLDAVLARLRGDA